MSRKTFTYKGCNVTPVKDKLGRYFGNPDFPTNKTQYRTLYWKAWFPDKTWCYVGTVAEAKTYIDKELHKHQAA